MNKHASGSVTVFQMSMIFIPFVGTDEVKPYQIFQLNVSSGSKDTDCSNMTLFRALSANILNDRTTVNLKVLYLVSWSQFGNQNSPGRFQMYMANDCLNNINLPNGLLEVTNRHLMCGHFDGK